MLVAIPFANGAEGHNNKSCMFEKAHNSCIGPERRTLSSIISLDDSHESYKG